MTPESDVLARMLPLLQGLALACLGVAAGVQFLDVPENPATGRTVFGIIWAGVLLIVAVCWILRSRTAAPRTRAGLSITVAVASVPTVLLGVLSGFTVPLLLLATALLVLDISVRAGILGIGVIVVGGILLHAMSGSLWAVLNGVVNTLPVAAVLGFGLVLGIALRGYRERRAADEGVIDALRVAAETERELVLAEERARSARDLHDGLGHRLTLVSMSLDFAERARGRDPEAAWSEVITARRATQEALDEMRVWVRALSPVRESGTRGTAALEAIADSFRGTGLRVEVTADAESDRLLTGESADDALSLLVLRIVQEGLTNAVRHGNARTVSISLEAVDDGVLLCLENDLGAEALESVPHGEARAGFGLRGIAERAERRGGHSRARREGDRFLLAVHLRVAASADGGSPPAGEAEVGARPASRERFRSGDGPSGTEEVRT